MKDEKYLTLAEVAKVLRVDQERLRRVARRGKIPGAVILPSGETRFDRDVLSAWLESKTVKGLAGGKTAMGDQKKDC